MTPGKIYLASAFERADEMRGARDVLVALGCQVTSRWLEEASGDGLGAGDLTSNPERGTLYAETDLADIRAADTVVSFTGQSARGGRHVEFGVAIALGKHLVLVGPREHVFHTLPAIEWYPDWSRLVMVLSRAVRA